MTDYKYYTNESIKATTGLVAAYSPSPKTVSNGTVVDISGNGNNGTISGALLSKEGMKFDGVDDKVTIGDIGNVRTIALRVKLNSTSEKILEGQANDILVYSNAGTLTYSDFDNTYINGTDSDTVVSGKWIDVVITSSTDVDCSVLTLALNNATYGNLEISDVRFYSDEKDSEFVKAYHNSFVKPCLLEDFSSNGVGNKPKEWIDGTGEYEVQELTAQDDVLKELDVGTKYLENTSDGTTAIQSKQAYGEWTWDLYKGADGNTAVIQFISSTNGTSSEDSYRILLDSSERVRLIRRDAGSGTDLAVTGNSYISNNTWYRLKVARLQSEGTFASIVPSMTTTYPADTFAVFIKGGEFGDDYTLVDTTGGSGSNPVTDSTYTTSEYFVTDLDAGDKIGNIKLINGVKQ